jgi:hypothetical protein
MSNDPASVKRFRIGYIHEINNVRLLKRGAGLTRDVGPRGRARIATRSVGVGDLRRRVASLGELLDRSNQRGLSQRAIAIPTLGWRLRVESCLTNLFGNNFRFSTSARQRDPAGAGPLPRAPRPRASGLAIII